MVAIWRNRMASPLSRQKNQGGLGDNFQWSASHLIMVRPAAGLRLLSRAPRLHLPSCISYFALLLWRREMAAVAWGCALLRRRRGGARGDAVCSDGCEASQWCAVSAACALLHAYEEAALRVSLQ